MRRVFHSVFFFLSAALSGCVEHECCIIQETSELTGTWLLYEAGYSPGVGYVTEAIPAKPPQTLTIDHYNVSSTVEGMEPFKYYKILTDTATTPHSPYIALYTKDPGVTNNPPDAGPTYSFDLTNNILTLRFRWCYEGCHMAFRKIK